LLAIASPAIPATAQEICNPLARPVWRSLVTTRPAGQSRTATISRLARDVWRRYRHRCRDRRRRASEGRSDV